MAAAQPLARLRSIGWSGAAVERLAELAGGSFRRPDDVGRVIDALGYDPGWQQRYQVRSAQSALMAGRVMCLDAALLAYALLEAFPGTGRRLLAMHRRGPDGQECGHVVACHWSGTGLIGAFSKSSYAPLGHRERRHASLESVALSYAEGYVSMGFTPLYFGLPRVESTGLDWRFSPGPLNDLLPLFTESYEFAFELEPTGSRP
jgi:hypothetical protein